MKYLQYVMTGALVFSSVFAKDLPENRSWNKFNFAPKLAADAPAYSLINIGNFGYWQKYDAYSAHTPSCLLYTSPSPRDRTRSRMPSSA